MNRRCQSPLGPARIVPSLPRVRGAARALFFGLVPLGTFLLLFGPAQSASRAATVDFKRQIEPILVKRCSECHGIDAQKGKLRLDTRAGALQGGKSGKPAVVPGAGARSEILARVTSSDPDERMPPKGEPLDADQIARLRDWIEQGASWPEEDRASHWSFIAPVRAPPPAVSSVPSDAPSVRNDLDRFILARLEKEGLRPQPEADRYTLIRRVSLDLTGLPPRWSEVAAFVRDPSPEAYERVVDRLLASPHYGEHIGRWWLDLARYADSNGYQVDLARSIWPYREWVIRALNRNQPFDRFTIEQLAGDLLPQATLEQKIATGFNRNTKINDEGGGDGEEYRTKAVKDRVSTVATTWLGLTMMCCECHSHKYDPLTQEDYYRFYAIFNNTTDEGNYKVAPTLEVPAPDRSQLKAHLRRRIDEVEHDLAGILQNLPREQAAWERRVRGKTNIWSPLPLLNAISTGGAGYTNLPDRSVLAQGVNPIYDTIVLESGTGLSGITALLLEALPDPSLPHGGPGRWGKSGNFILDEFAAWIVPAAGSSAARLSSTNLLFARAQADWEQEYYRAAHAIDGNPKTGWAIGPKFGEPHFLLLDLKEPLRAGAAAGGKLGFRLEHYHGNSHVIGRIRLSVTSEPDPEARWPIPGEIAGLLAVPDRKRTEDQRKRLAAFYRSVSPRARELGRELARLKERQSALTREKYSTLVMSERERPRETFVHLRGNFLDPGQAVSPGIPAVFGRGQPPATNRLALAQWLVDGRNPLTARVTVNRLWERFFGIGLVKTSEDFGRQGEAPSHPELLDWLACEFMEPAAVRYDETAPASGAAAARPQAWDLKHIQKLIVLSAAYRRSPAAPADLLQRDPANRLLARGPRFRLDAEMIRDHALAVSGLLNPDLGGPSVYPVQVPNLWKELGFLRPEIGMDEWPVSEGPDLYRRAVYTFWRRVCTYPTLATFDAPSRDVCLARRPRTNTPLQALAGLNESTLLEAARVFAQRVLQEGGAGAGERVEFAFRSCLQRPPTAAEKLRLITFLEQQRQSFRRDPKAAEALVGVGTAPRPETLDVRELAAWVMVANVLFNLDETLTKG